MVQQEAVAREFVTVVESRRASVLNGLGLGLLLGLVALLSVDGQLRVLLVAAGLLVGLALAPLWSPAETLWLEGTTLVARKGRRRTGVDLSVLASVSRSWVPKKGDTLRLTDDRSQTINIWLLDERTAKLRGAIGLRARFPRANTDLHDPKTRQLLLLNR